MFRLDRIETMDTSGVYIIRIINEENTLDVNESYTVLCSGTTPRLKIESIFDNKSREIVSDDILSGKKFTYYKLK